MAISSLRENAVTSPNILPKEVIKAYPYVDVSSDLVVQTHLTYELLDLDKVISYPAFYEGVKGSTLIDPDHSELLTLIDFSKPSNEQRLAVVDLKAGRVIETSVVSHGQGSGDLYATKFSNREGSHQSSLGFYRTLTTYQGNNGYSLRLEGLEVGFNDHALSRAIVVHGADYCTEDVTRTGRRLGRSWGCPALPLEKARTIIDTIKGGSLLFIYAKDDHYLSSSPILTNERYKG